jgi:hypothetical protein
MSRDGVVIRRFEPGDEAAVGSLHREVSSRNAPGELSEQAELRRSGA